MVRRSTLFLVVIFLLALAGYLLLNRQQEQAAAQITPTAATQPLFEIEASQLTGIQVADAAGREVRLERISGAWVLIDPTATVTDTASADSLASQIASLTARCLIENPPAASATGLEPPTYTLRLQLEDGSRRVAEVGRETPTQSGYYVRLDNNRLAVVSSYSIEGITGVLDNPPIYLTPTVGLTPLSPELLPTSGTPATPTP
jgi:hypothetical protein